VPSVSVDGAVVAVVVETTFSDSVVVVVSSSFVDGTAWVSTVMLA
jgi:hypothetical protein